MDLLGSSWSFNRDCDSCSFAVKPWVEVMSQSWDARGNFAGTSVGISLYDQCSRLWPRTL